MTIVYRSKYGKTEAFLKESGLLDGAIKIADGSETVTTPYVLITSTTGAGEVPEEVSKFMENNSANIKGVVGAGKTSYGENFANAGNVISSEFNTPLLHKVDVTAYTPADVAKVKEVVGK